jgi:AcrR family transcriptional regulator
MSRALPTGAASAPAEVRPLRADARRNRERILKAAGKVFSEQGRDAQMDDVARRAKVGVGTVYRHFPTKEALIEELASDRLRELAAWVREGLREDRDPWDAFVDVLWRAGELHAADRTLSTVIHEAKMQVAARECGVIDAMAELMARAQRAGALRADATPDDVGMVMCGLGTVLQMGERGDWRRYLSLAIDGLRAQPAPVESPSTA